jgi:hypothetical protein
MKCRYLIMLVVPFVTGTVDAREIWHGWMNLTPCSRVVWRNNGIGGLPSPTVQTAPQELHGYLDLNIPDEQAIVQVAQDCAKRGAEAAGIAAVLTNWSGAWPAFQAEWNSCIASAPKKIAENSFNLRTDNSCKW